MKDSYTTALIITVQEVSENHNGHKHLRKPKKMFKGNWKDQIPQSYYLGFK